MKKYLNILIYFSFSIIISLIIIGCNKLILVEEPMPKPNRLLILHNSVLVDIIASDVYTTIDSFQRKIEIIDRSNDVIKDVFYVTMKSNDFKTNIYTQLKNKKFTGTLTIINNNEIILLKESKKVENFINNYSASNVIKTNLIPTCNINVVHNCVANKIDEMSIFEYGVCLIAAPECYAGIWASCGWTNCIKGELK
jgi:hypothetical protein